jgi:hypothetical protein
MTISFALSLLGARSPMTGCLLSKIGDMVHRASMALGFWGMGWFDSTCFIRGIPYMRQGLGCIGGVWMDSMVG